MKHNQKAYPFVHLLGIPLFSIFFPEGQPHTKGRACTFAVRQVRVTILSPKLLALRILEMSAKLAELWTLPW